MPIRIHRLASAAMAEANHTIAAGNRKLAAVSIQKVKIMKHAIIAVACSAVLAGCATNDQPITPMAISGSKADATVVMGFERNIYLTGKADWKAALQSATARCVKWGYKSAEGFDGTANQCTARNEYGCMQWQISRTYQCA